MSNAPFYVLTRFCRCGREVDIFKRWNGLRYQRAYQVADRWVDHCPSCGMALTRETLTDEPPPGWEYRTEPLGPEWNDAIPF